VLLLTRRDSHWRSYCGRALLCCHDVAVRHGRYHGVWGGQHVGFSRGAVVDPSRGIRILVGRPGRRHAVACGLRQGCGCWQRQRTLWFEQRRRHRERLSAVVRLWVAAGWRACCWLGSGAVIWRRYCSQQPGWNLQRKRCRCRGSNAAGRLWDPRIRVT